MSDIEILLADPPWDFEVWDEDTGSGGAARAPNNNTEMSR
jgi:hypothetical protein